MAYVKKEIFAKRLKLKLYRELKQSGFKISLKEIRPPDLSNKNALRRAHRTAKEHLLIKNKEWILENRRTLKEKFADGNDIQPTEIYPELKLIDTQEEADLFRYASYLWSVPLSNGFGRRLRYLVLDKSNDKLIGLIGLTDPVIGLGVRDKWIGWSKEQKEKMLWHVMDAYTFGAIPPYSHLLCGKLVATLMTSNEVRRDFKEKYSHGRTEISHKNYSERGADLVLLTTTGAFGESSILDRLQTLEGIAKGGSRKKRLLWEHIGFTEGWGFFHLNNGVATDTFDYLKAIKDPIVEAHKFGEGPNWKMRLINRGLRRLGIDYQKYNKHGVKRGFYISPLAKNYKAFLNGQNKKPQYYNQNIDDLFGFFKERYLLPRSERNFEWKKFNFNVYNHKMVGSYLN